MIGTPLNLDWISRRFKAIAREAGLPVIKFDGARHTAATLALQGKVGAKIVSETVVALLPERPRKTGS